MTAQGTGEAVLSNRQRKLNSKRIRAEQAAMPKPEPKAREEYIPAEAKHADDHIIPGKSGRGAVLRIDNLQKLSGSGRITKVQADAGLNLIKIVSDFYTKTSPFARESDMARQLGGDGDPIRLYLKARRKYVPTQRPRSPSSDRSHNDGWTGPKFMAMADFAQVSKFMERLSEDQRDAIQFLIIDPLRPYTQPLSLSAAAARRFGYRDTKCETKLVQWLASALDVAHADLPERIILPENEIEFEEAA